MSSVNVPAGETVKTKTLSEIMEEEWTPSELAKFEVVALGCHQSLYNELAVFFAEYGIEAFQVVEYFTNVVSHNSNSPANVFFPFLRRTLEHNLFHHVGENSTQTFQPLTCKLRDFYEYESKETAGEYVPRRFVFPLSKAPIGGKIHGIWNGTKTKDDTQLMVGSLVVQDGDVSFWNAYETSIAEEHEHKDITSIEFDLLGRNWKACGDGIKIKVGSYPICSKDIFYGYFIVIWPQPSTASETPQPSTASETDRWGKVPPDKLAEILQKQVAGFYAPTLALLHNSFWEKRFQCILDLFEKEILNEKQESRRNVDLGSIIRNIPMATSLGEEDGSIEGGLARLWQQRRGLLEEPSEPEHISRKKVRESLLFCQYNIASPGMIEQVKKIIRRAPRLSQPTENGQRLPAALVYGEPGSGKDIMAKLIPLFTSPYWTNGPSINRTEKPPGYFGKSPYTINMAALKPNALFGPLFSGMKFSNLANVNSILTQCKKANAESETVEGGEENCIEPSIFVLDELNSLDIDLQGILLRILENGEVTKLFEIKPAHIKHMIVGIVNEDPKMLIKDDEKREIEQIRELTGKLLGQALNEFLRKGRRLRPDLFYRFCRDLYIELPALRKRREDIPILFYFECETAVKIELRASNKWELCDGKSAPTPAQADRSANAGSTNEVTKPKKKVYMCVEFKAYELLMKPVFDWPGNIRQLQSVAAKVAAEAVSKFIQEDGGERPGILNISRSQVCGVLHEHFPNLRDENIERL